jgi:hypothetical protein
MGYAKLSKLVKSGQGLVGRPLGPLQLTMGFSGTAGGFYLLTAVELQFSIDPAALLLFSTFAAKQWAGPDVTWVKKGPPMGTPWIKLSNGKGGSDDPDAGLVANKTQSPLPVIAFYDNPGAPVSALTKQGISRAMLIQNFTSWIEGVPKAGGVAQGLCDPVASWYCVTSMVNPGWEKNDPGQWIHMYGGRVDTGWSDITQPPVVP